MSNHRLGDLCPTCNSGVLQVRRTKTSDGIRTRYLYCNLGCGPQGKEIVRVDHIGRVQVSAGTTKMENKDFHCPCCGHKVEAVQVAEQMAATE